MTGTAADTGAQALRALRTGRENIPLAATDENLNNDAALLWPRRDREDEAEREGHHPAGDHRTDATRRTCFGGSGSGSFGLRSGGLA